MTYRPLSVRMGGDAQTFEALAEGVPSWLRSSITEFIARAFNELRNEGVMPVETELRFERNFHVDLHAMLRTRPPQDRLSVYVGNLIIKGSFDTALNAIDALLYLLPPISVSAQYLETSLSEAGSAWKVGSNGEGHYGLERRVDETVTADAELLMAAGDRPGEHLRLAWHKVYGRNPDPSGGFREAVRAIESAAHPIVTPADGVPTLGKMIRALKDKPEKWTVTFNPANGEPDGVTVVTDMMRLVWRSQLDRHGTSDESAPFAVEREEAEAAVHAAVTLVHWFTSGAIAPAP